jgi:hypothetical protein
MVEAAQKNIWADHPEKSMTGLVLILTITLKSIITCICETLLALTK